MIRTNNLLHFLVTSRPLRKNLALHPPQKSASQVAVGNAGHEANRHGFTKQFTRSCPSGQPARKGKECRSNYLYDKFTIILETNCNDVIKHYNNEWIIKLTTSGYTLLQRFKVVQVSLATAINE